MGYSQWPPAACRHPLMALNGFIASQLCSRFTSTANGFHVAVPVFRHSHRTPVARVHSLLPGVVPTQSQSLVDGFNATDGETGLIAHASSTRAYATSTGVPVRVPLVNPGLRRSSRNACEGAGTSTHRGVNFGSLVCRATGDCPKQAPAKINQHKPIHCFMPLRTTCIDNFQSL